MNVARIILVSAVFVIGVAGSASASTIGITCPTVGTGDRYGTVTNTNTCVTVGPASGTPTAADVQTAFGFGPWYSAGAVNPTTPGGTNGWLTIGLTNGSWGSLPVTGTYEINPTVWTLNVPVALTFHLGNGSGDPDWFFYLLDQNTLSGTFTFWKESGRGGGFSNAFLWVDPPLCDAVGCDPTETPVPEPASLLLLGSGLVFAAARMRKRTRASK